MAYSSLNPSIIHLLPFLAKWSKTACFSSSVISFIDFPLKVDSFVNRIVPIITIVLLCYLFKLIHIPVHQVQDPFVILARLIVLASALYDLPVLRINLNRFRSLAFHPCSDNQTMVMFVVIIREYAVT